MTALGRDVSLPALRRARARDQHGAFLLQQARRSLPHLHRAGQRARGRPQRLVDERKSLQRAPSLVGIPLPQLLTTATLQAAAAHYGFAFDFALPVKDYTPRPARPVASSAWTARASAATSPQITPPATVRARALRGRRHQSAAALRRPHHAHAAEADYRDKLEDFLLTQTCPDCAGTRLRAESRG